MPPTRSNSKNPEPVVTQEDINKLGNDITKAVDLLRTDILEIRDAIILKTSWMKTKGSSQE